jgi:hypothetical protein
MHGKHPFPETRDGPRRARSRARAAERHDPPAAASSPRPPMLQIRAIVGSCLEVAEVDDESCPSFRITLARRGELRAPRVAEGRRVADERR